MKNSGGFAPAGPKPGGFFTLRDPPGNFKGMN